MSRLLALALALGLLGPALAHAQVVLDGSLGASGPVPGGLLPDGTSATYRIDESFGERHDENLFHSFSRFGIPAGASAAFVGEPRIERVIARVTGEESSIIDGRLRSTIPNADLYLLNPRGVFFGPDATLDLAGSFYVSASSSLRLADGKVFSASPVSDGVLSSAAPSAWGFADGAIGLVRISAKGDFGVRPGETLSAVGGAVTVRGQGRTSARISAPGATIALAARTTPGELPVDISELDARAALPGALGSVSILAGSSLDVSDAGGLASQRGRVVIRAGKLVLSDRAVIQALSPRDAPDGARDIDLETTDSIAVELSSTVSSTSSGAGRGGAMRLSSNEISVSGGSRVLTIGFNTARAGAVELDGERLFFSGAARVGSSAGEAADVGSVRIDAGRLEVTSGAQITTTTEGAGRGGGIEIGARDFVHLDGSAFTGPSGVFARSGLGPGTGATGDGGRLSVETPVLTLSDGAEISTATFGVGRSGSVRIEAADRVEISGGPTTLSSINARAASLGAGGDIEIETATLDVQAGGEIAVSTLDRGGSGDVRVYAGRITVGGGEASEGGPGAIFAQSNDLLNPVDAGAGGDIELHVGERLDIRDGGIISVATRGAGNAGEIRVLDADLVRIEEGTLRARSEGSGRAGSVTLSGVDALEVDRGGSISTETVLSGPGGAISISARSRLVVADGGEISAKTEGRGDAGEIQVRGPRRVRIADGTLRATSEGSGRAGSVTLDRVGLLHVGRGGSITTETLQDGPGGAISIRANREIVVANGGEISARSDGTGDAGSIAIDAGQRLTARDGGRVTTQAETAFGGNIDVRARQIIYVRDGEITTSVDEGAGDGGDISLDPEFVLLDGGTIAARANAGNGGNIRIQTSHFLQDFSSTVDASSQLGIDGQIEITSPVVDLSSELAALEANFLDASSELAKTCAARSGELGTFVVRGGARPVSPDAPLGAPSEAERASGCPDPEP